MFTNKCLGFYKCILFASNLMTGKRDKFWCYQLDINKRFANKFFQIKVKDYSF